jgi:hypothetical protein
LTLRTHAAPLNTGNLTSHTGGARFLPDLAHYAVIATIAHATGINNCIATPDAVAVPFTVVGTVLIACPAIIPQIYTHQDSSAIRAATSRVCRAVRPNTIPTTINIVPAVGHIGTVEACCAVTIANTALVDNLVAPWITSAVEAAIYVLDPNSEHLDDSFTLHDLLHEPTKLEGLAFRARAFARGTQLSLQILCLTVDTAPGSRRSDRKQPYARLRALSPRAKTLRNAKECIFIGKR